MEQRIKTYVYVDGFNLYFGAIKPNKDFHWLDVAKLVQFAYPNSHICRVKYFYAKLNSRKEDPDQPFRQQQYIRALEASGIAKTVSGKFHNRVVALPLCDNNREPIYDADTKRRKMVYVEKTEEKRSDVNLACALLMDAYQDQFDRAIIISNDSDLTTAVSMARHVFKKQLFMINPQMGENKPNRGALVEAANRAVKIKREWLEASQFPDEIQDKDGRTVRKPAKW